MKKLSRPRSPSPTFCLHPYLLYALHVSHWTFLFLQTSSCSLSPKSNRTRSFQVTLSEDADAKSLISCVPWTKAKQPSIVKDFPSIPKDHKFAKEYNIVIQTYPPGFSDLYQVAHVLGGKDPAQHRRKQLTRMTLKNLENCKRETNPLPC